MATRVSRSGPMSAGGVVLLMFIGVLNLGRLDLAFAQSPRWQEFEKVTTEYWDLDEEWRLESYGDELIYGTARVSADETGRVYLLNLVLGRMFVYDRDGELVTEFLRFGEGPGELSHPIDFCLADDDRLCVMSAMPAKLSWFTREGVFLKDTTPETNAEEGWGTNVLLGFLESASGMAIGVNRLEFLDGGRMRNRSMLWLARADGSFDVPFESIVERDPGERVIRERIEERPLWSVMAVGTEGTVYHAPAWNGYRVIAVEDGVQRDHVVVEYPSLARPSEMTSETKDRLERHGGAMFYDTAHNEIEIETNWPDLIEFRVDGEDQLWILSSHGFRERREGVIRSYEVFDEHGAIVKRVVLRGDAWDLGATVHFLDEDGIALITRAYGDAQVDDEDSQVIVCDVKKSVGAAGKRVPGSR